MCTVTPTVSMLHSRMTDLVNAIRDLQKWLTCFESFHKESGTGGEKLQPLCPISCFTQDPQKTLKTSCLRN